MSRRNNAYRDGKVHVCVRKCSTCIYRPGNLMRLDEDRVASMEAAAIADGGAIICHKTLDVDNAVCKGFFDVNKNLVPALQIADRLGYIEHDNPEEK